MASKNITIIATVVLIALGFFGGKYLGGIYSHYSSATKVQKNKDIITTEKIDKTVNEIKLVEPEINETNQRQAKFKRELIFTDIDAGRDVALSDLRGKLVVLNLWRTSCSTCAKELHEFTATKKAYKDKPVEFIALSLDTRNPVKTRNFLKENKLKIEPLYIDNRHTVKTQYKPESVPETLFISPTGELIYSVKGSINWRTKKTHRAIKSLLPKVR